MREIEQDGFITDEIYIQETKPLERVDMDTAIPSKDCKYPKCEECRDYRNGYCTVPMVFTKQMYLMGEEEMHKLREKLDALEDLVYDELFTQEIEVEIDSDGKLRRKSNAPFVVIRDTTVREKSSAETGNYSVGDEV